MYLRKWYLSRLYFYILILVLFGLFMAGTTAALAADTGISGRVVKASNPTVGIEGIRITAFQITDTAKKPVTYDETDGQGYFSITNLNDWFLQGDEERDFYLCASDPDNRKYITECYDGYYWFYTGEGADGSGGTPITVERYCMTPNIVFQLREGGDITVNLSVPHDYGYKITLEGIVNYKNTQNFYSNWPMFYTDPNNLPTSIHLKDHPSVGPLPYGTYSVKVEDINQAVYYDEIYNTDASYLYHYHPYEVAQDNYFSSQEATGIVLSSSNINPTINFPTFSNAFGVIYGIVTDPNYIVETEAKDVTIEPSLYNCEQQLYLWEDSNAVDWEGRITLSVDDECMTEGVNYTHVEIIPIDGQQLLFPSSIQTKVMVNRDFESEWFYFTGKYGGYAFKFLPPGDYKVRAYRRLGNTDILSVYYNNSTSVAYSLANAKTITVTPSGNVQRFDFKLKTAKISGKVVISNGGSLADVRVSLLSSGYEEICYKTFTASDSGNFEFHEIVSGDLIVRAAKPGYETKKVNVSDLPMGGSRTLANIVLNTFQMPTGNGSITGRVFREDNPGEGLQDITVRVLDVEYLGEQYGGCEWEVITGTGGYYTINDLPEEDGFVVYAVVDPNGSDSEYFSEMYENVTAFPNLESLWKAEVEDLGKILIEKIQPTHLDDPNILVSVVFLDENDEAVVDFGLSKYQYPAYKGMNLFAYPGEPLIAVNTAHELIDESFYEIIIEDNCPLAEPICHSLMSSVPSSQPGIGNEWELAYYDPDSNMVKGDDFKIELGHGYVFYSLSDVENLLFPPFYIPSPTPLDLVQGLNLISMPDRFDQGHHALDVLSDLGNGGQSASINNYNPQAGKWETMTWIWGKPAGDNFTIERPRGYLIYMKNSLQWP